MRSRARGQSPAATPAAGRLYSIRTRCSQEGDDVHARKLSQSSATFSLTCFADGSDMAIIKVADQIK